MSPMRPQYFRDFRKGSGRLTVAGVRIVRRPIRPTLRCDGGGKYRRGGFPRRFPAIQGLQGLRPALLESPRPGRLVRRQAIGFRMFHAPHFEIVGRRIKGRKDGG